ncbi:alpha/beta fold hydrolase [Fulvivirga aurantia]|uniref:alpha/beta fold hydrolase n=1 Tax=Fulvivirga aurantia TaxID=2529383 RepID=UPI0012BBEC90
MLYSLQTNLIFYPEKISDDYAYDLRLNGEEHFIKTQDGETINALYFEGDKSETILYFHGNAGSLKDWQYISQDFTSLGYNFLIIDYRGYGKSTGSISEKGLYEDAEATLKFLQDNKSINKEQVIIYGRSIGSGVATELASKHKTKGLILESPFSSLKKLANQKMPIFLPSLILKYHFDNLSKINKVSGPILIVHGSKDSLIPVSHAQTLHKHYTGKQKLLIIPGADHNDLNAFPEYHRALAETLTHFF